jgi:hypothetical protein
VAEHVIVRFKDALGVPYQDDVWKRVSQIVGPRWDAITAEFGSLPIHRVFRDAVPLAKQAQDAYAAGDRPEPYFDVVLPDTDTAKRFIQRLRELRNDVVAEVYPRGEASPARGATPVPAGVMRVPDSQGYLQPKPYGIDAAAAWNLHQAQGQGVTIADIELGWFLEHEMLPPDIPLDYGENASNKDHGVAVMGILVADHDRSLVKGGAPQARTMAFSYAKSMTEQVDRAVVIDAAMRRLAPGDILLLEFCESVDDEEKNIHMVQAPAEAKRHIKGVIRQCTEKGIIVIEPAGNSGADLKPLALEKNHSGAIIVGASFNDGNGTHRWEAKGYPCNYGARVNCFAWGHDIHTLGEPPDGYQVFSSTSGASAIIAVAAALVQSVARRHFRGIGRDPDYLTPEEMLALLSNADLGTLSEDHDHHPIGVMPSLGLVIERFLAEHPGPDHAGFRAMPAVKKRTGHTKKTGKVSTPRAKVRKK